MNATTSLPSNAVGTVYGVLLNDQRTLDRLARQLHEAPYKAPPVAPILYVKPRNTLAGDGAHVAIPADPGQVRIDATVGAVIGTTATAVDAAHALAHVAGFVIVSDVTLPHENYYRPAIPQRCRDGFCPMSAMRPAAQFDPATARLRVLADGQNVYDGDFTHLVRDLPRLIADVTEFMTLDVGDVLLIGLPENAPVVSAGAQIEIQVDGLGALRHTVVAEQGDPA